VAAAPRRTDHSTPLSFTAGSPQRIRHTTSDSAAERDAPDDRVAPYAERTIKPPLGGPAGERGHDVPGSASPDAAGQRARSPHTVPEFVQCHKR